MDFKSAPKDKFGFNLIFVVMDCFSKEVTSIPCYFTCMIQDLAQLFISNCWRFNSSPEFIISDQGLQFISLFWKEFCHIFGIKVKLSTAYHAQTNGQIEIMN